MTISSSDLSRLSTLGLALALASGSVSDSVSDSESDSETESGQARSGRLPVITIGGENNRV